MDNTHSPIIPVQFIPLLENAARTDPPKAAFLILALLDAWRGDLDITDPPPEYLDAWLALQGNFRTLYAKIVGGKKGGRPAKSKTSNAEGFDTETSNAEGFDTETSNASIVEYSRGKDRKIYSVDPEFEVFWEAYGKKVGRATAEASFAKAKKSKDWPGMDILLAAVETWRKSDQWTKDGGQFQPHAATWLNQHRWTDEPPQTTTTTQNGMPPGYILHQTDKDAVREDF
jgi:hypothetical protein